VKISRVLAFASPLALVAAAPLLLGATPNLCHDIIITPNGSGTIRFDLTMGSTIQVPSMFGSRVAVTATKSGSVTISPARDGELSLVGGQSDAVTMRGQRGTAKLEPGMRLVLSPNGSRSLNVSTTGAATVVIGPEADRLEAGIVSASSAPTAPVTPY